MKPPLVVLQVLAAVTLLSGVAVFFSGHSLPVYTDPGAPEELSRKLENLPREERFHQWYQQLEQYETSHKLLRDFPQATDGPREGIDCLGARDLHRGTLPALAAQDQR